MNSSSRQFRVFETICQELLVRLQGDHSREALAFAADAQRLMVALDAWRRELPTQDARAATIAQVLDLHRKAMEYLTVIGHKPTSF
jgi:hypothetical protein